MWRTLNTRSTASAILNFIRQSHMQKLLYTFLFFVTLGLIGYTGYYAFIHPPVIQVIATPQPTATTTPNEKAGKTTVYRTSDGKEISVTETNPAGESLSTITLVTTGFTTNQPMILEKNKLTNVYLADLNKDTHEELILITTSAGSGSYGEVDIYTTTSSSSLISLPVPQITEEDSKPGKLFEGYMGHDTFSLINNTLIRSYPVYSASSTNTAPTGIERQMQYILKEKNGLFTVELIKAPSLPQTATTTSQSSTTTVKSATTTTTKK